MADESHRSPFRDQYEDGKAARSIAFQERTPAFNDWLLGLMRARGCRTVLDAACGTGLDSIFLLENGFDVISADVSDQMLKYALEERWERRKEPAFDNWVIKQANWLTLHDDLKGINKPAGGFDAVLCVGNSLAHLPNPVGDFVDQRLSLKNLYAMVKPGGILILDHRNYDDIIKDGAVSSRKNVCFKYDFTYENISILTRNGRPTEIILDYSIDMSALVGTHTELHYRELKPEDTASAFKFRLTFFPFMLDEITANCKEMFGEHVKHDIYGDFKPLGEVEAPAYYFHVLEKPQI